MGRVLQLREMPLFSAEVGVWPEWKNQVRAGYWDILTLPRTAGQIAGNVG